MADLESGIATAAVAIEDIYAIGKFRRSIIYNFSEKVLSNVSNNPNDPKYRKINGAKVQNLMLKKGNNDAQIYPRLEALLLSAGFVRSFNSNFLELSDNKLELCQTVLALLRERNEEEEGKMEAQRKAIEARNAALLSEADKKIQSSKQKLNNLKKNIETEKKDISQQHKPSISSKASKMSFGRTDVKVEFKCNTGGG